jgi:hypothetical protein
MRVSVGRHTKATNHAIKKASPTEGDTHRWTIREFLVDDEGIHRVSSCGGKEALGLPPKAAQAEGLPEGAAAIPFEGAHEPHGGWCRPLLQVVPDYKRFSAVLAAGRAGHRRASRLQYPGLSVSRSRGRVATARDALG